MAALILSWVLYGLAIIILAVFSSMYLYMTRNFKYWANRGVREEKPMPFFGNFFDTSVLRKSAGATFEHLYTKHKGHDKIGFYIYDQPCLLVRDPNLVNQIMIKDFHVFPNRYVKAGDHDPLGSANLFVIRNPTHWKTVRAKLSPTMTSGKLKKMFELMVSVGKDLDTHLESLNLEAEGRVIEMREICARFTTDIIATCAYGLRANCLNNPDAEFRKYGKKIFEPTWTRGFELASIFFAPGIVKPLRLMLFEKSTSEFLRKAVWGTLIHRMKSGVFRNDLIDTLIELKKNQAQADIEDSNSFKFDGDNLTAQAAIYFTGGFETTSITIAFTLYELALNQDIQSRLRREITTALVENKGEPRYEWVLQLPYLDMVVSETLRKYPVLGYIERESIRDYKVPDSDFVIEKGTPVFISTSGFHHDPEYFPEPEKYDPERFKSENNQKLSRVYMPFGKGPRNCIGLRFGLISVKLGLIKTIPFYKISPSKDTAIPLRINPKSHFTTIDGDLLLHVQKVTTTDLS